MAPAAKAKAYGKIGVEKGHCKAPKTAATGSTKAEPCPYIKLFDLLIPILATALQQQFKILNSNPNG
jgi:hypothetical protein